MKYGHWFSVLLAVGAGCQREDVDDACSGFGCAGPGGEGQSEATTDGDDPTGGEDSTGTGDAGLCAPEATHCLDDNKIQLCDPEDGKIYKFSCEYFCGPEVESLGCHAGSDGESCFCGDPIEPCAAGETQTCAAGNALAQCEGGRWRGHDCDAICVEAGYLGAYAEAACEANDEGVDVCMCTNEFCVPGVGRCSGTDAMAFCTGDAWEVYSCDQLCAEQDLGVSIGCRYRADVAAETCLCA